MGLEVLDKISIELEKEVRCYNDFAHTNYTVKIVVRKGNDYDSTSMDAPVKKAYSIFNKTLFNTTGNFDEKKFNQ